MNLQYKFKTFSFDVNNIVTSTDISLAINKFYLEELTNVDSNIKFSILFMIKSFKGDLINISSLQTLDKTKVDDLKEIFNLFWTCKSDVFKGIIVSKIIFRYRPLEKDIAPGENIFRYPTNFDKSNELLPQGYTNLPNNRLFETWGDDICINGDNTYTVYKNNDLFLIRQLDNEYFITLKYKDKELFNFHDLYELDDKTNNTFIRTIGSSQLYYNNGVHHFIKVENTSNFKGRIKYFL